MHCSCIAILSGRNTIDLHNSSLKSVEQHITVIKIIIVHLHSCKMFLNSACHTQIPFHFVSEQMCFFLLPSKSTFIIAIYQGASARHKLVK